MPRNDGPDGPTDAGDRPAGLNDRGDDGGVPDFPAARKHVLTELFRFVADLRAEGASVAGSATLDAARALAAVGLDDERRVAAALRATLLSERADAEAFDEAFPTFWHRLRTGLDRIATAADGPSPSGDDEGETAGSSADGGADDGDADLLADADPPELDGGGDGEIEVRIPTDRRRASGDRPADGEGDARRYSRAGESQPVDAATPSGPDDAAAIDRFVDALSSLPGRRRRRATAGPDVDARGALRASLATGGVPVDLPRREPTPSELRCCLLVDVSGSVLDTVDRSALLALAERATTRALDARVFLFDTDLVEATDAFARADGEPAAALRAANVEWGGGTRIGHAFDALRRTAPYAVDRRTVVVVVSDGLDVGDSADLADGITWLADRASAVVWLNPLAVSPAYEPTSRGMATVLPYVDALFGFAAADDLAEAARQLETRGLAGAVGYERDGGRSRSAADGGDPA
ncbi:VWA domain-containing protein [Halostella litorea]|uniref:VWA domain-containing protein n=1 Tax=Halostella litorea TaxID=2528831 RepID=UPI0010927E59|nr:VWA domain-containing protein [Halostella litorea]